MAVTHSHAAQDVSSALNSPRCLGSTSAPAYTSKTVLKGLSPGNRGGLKGWWSCEDVSGINLGNLDGFAVSPLFGEDNFKGINAKLYQAMMPALRAATQVLASADSLAYLHSLCFGDRTTEVSGAGTEDEFSIVTFMDSTSGTLTPQQTLDINMVLTHVAQYLTLAFSSDTLGGETQRVSTAKITEFEGDGSDVYLPTAHIEQIQNMARARSEGKSVETVVEIATQFQLMCSLLTAIPHAVINAIRCSSGTSVFLYKTEIVSNVGLSYINHVLRGVPVLAKRPRKLEVAQQYCNASKLARGASVADSVCDIGGVIAFSNFDALILDNPWVREDNKLYVVASCCFAPAGFLGFHTRCPMAYLASFFNSETWYNDRDLKLEASAHAPVGYTAAKEDIEGDGWGCAGLMDDMCGGDDD